MKKKSWNGHRFISLKQNKNYYLHFLFTYIPFFQFSAWPIFKKILHKINTISHLPIYTPTTFGHSPNKVKTAIYTTFSFSSSSFPVWLYHLFYSPICSIITWLVSNVLCIPFFHFWLHPFSKKSFIKWILLVTPHLHPAPFVHSPNKVKTTIYTTFSSSSSSFFGLALLFILFSNMFYHFLVS